ncbi:hypothetical protein AC249_AIPGENE10376 [Exaiptasia diaphana]|nr:hypothetical protein AC249_AIPGENE10376 [Exaiptasia diaphana]
MIIVDPSVAKQPFPLSLLTCSREQGFCVKSSVVFLMSLYLKFCKSDNQKALDLLLSHDVSSFDGHYLKGWLFYENMKLDESLNSFNLCINMMDVTDCSRAAALCMAGCCLAKKVSLYQQPRLPVSSNFLAKSNGCLPRANIPFPLIDQSRLGS